MTQVVCLGDLMVDVLARLPGPLAMGSDTPAPIGLFGGGAAANVAAWLVAAGARATFVGRIGDDALGRRALDELAAAGVDTEVAVDPVRPTGTCIVLVDPSGERTMIPDSGANSGLGDAPFPTALLHSGAPVYVSGYSLLDDGARPAALKALSVARERGCPVVVDAASAAPLVAAGPDRFLSWLGGRLLLLANLDEAHVLTGLPDAAEAALDLGRRCGEAIVKSGPDGCCWSDGDEVITLPALRVDVVDTTGAGDAFAAGVLAARSAGAAVEATLRAGTALAARVIGQLGARPAGRTVTRQRR